MDGRQPYDPYHSWAELRHQVGTVTAVKRLRAAYAEDPSNLDLRGEFAAALVDNGNYGEASSLLGSMKPKADEPSSFRAAKLKHASMTGDAESATQIGEALLAETGPPALDLLTYADFMYLTGDAERRQLLLNRLYTAYPTMPAVLNALFISAYQSDLDEARSYADKMREVAPDHFSSYLAFGKLAFKARDFRLAEEYARQAVASEPGEPSVWRELGRALHYQEKCDEAKQCFEIAVAESDSDMTAFRSLASIALKAGDVDLASKYNAKADAAVPALKHIEKVSIAASLMKTEGPDAMIQALKRIEPDLPACYLRVSHALRCRGLIDLKRHDELRARLEDDWSTYNDDVFDLGRYELAMASDDTVDEALAIAQRRRATATNDGEWISAEIRALGRVGRLEDARTLYESLPDPVTGSSGALVFVALDQVGLKNEATEWLARAQRLFPRSQELEMLAAIQTMEAGELSEGLRRLRQLDPSLRPKLPGCLALSAALLLALPRVIWRSLTGQGRPKS